MTTNELLAALYDWEHDGFDEDARLYESLARRTGGPVLELACGSGRILGALARTGTPVVGIDRSPSMLQRAERRLAAVAPSGASSAQLQLGDLCGPLPPGPYGLVILALDAFGFVLEAGAQGALLGRVRQALTPGGLLALDLVHAAALWDQPQGIPVLQMTGTMREIAAHVTKWMVRRLRPAEQLLELTSFYDITWPDGRFQRVATPTTLRYFARFEIEQLLTAAGLAITGTYGDYQLGPFEDTSERMVMLATPAPRGAAC